MAELAKRIQASHGPHGTYHHHHQQQHQQQHQVVERYNQLSSSIDESTPSTATVPKPLSVV